MAEPAKVWMRSIAQHTYWNIPREPDTFYQVDSEQDADTIVALKMGVREAPPAKATREPSTAAAPARRGRAGAAPHVMTTADLPTPPKPDA